MGVLGEVVLSGGFVGNPQKPLAASARVPLSHPEMRRWTQQGLLSLTGKKEWTPLGEGSPQKSHEHDCQQVSRLVGVVNPFWMLDTEML